jgi:hypothetical protein
MCLAGSLSAEVADVYAAGTESVAKCTVAGLSLTGSSFPTERLRAVADQRCLVRGASDLRQRWRDRSASPPEEPFEGLREALKEGIRQFYYQSAAAARQTLATSFERLEQVSRDHEMPVEFAHVAREAAVVFVRATLKQHGADVTGARAMNVLTLIPNTQPSAREAPPKVRELFKAARDHLARAGGRLQVTVETWRRDSCQVLVNGAASPSGATVPLAAGQRYVVRAGCDGALGPRKVVSVEAGEAATVQVVSDLPTPEDRLLEATDVTRAEVGRYFDAVAQTMGVNRLVITLDSETGAMLLGVGRGERRWTQADGLRSEALTEALGDRWSDGTRSVVAPRESDRSRSPATTDLAMVSGGGALAVASGIYGVSVLLPRGRELACSPNSTARPGHCNQTAAISFDSEAAFDRALRDFRLARGVTVGASVVGVGVASWGLWRMMRRPQVPQRVRWRVDVRRGWVGVGIEGRLR